MTTLDIILFLLLISGGILIYFLIRNRATTIRLLKKTELQNQQLAELDSKNIGLSEINSYYKDLVETANDLIFRCDVNGYFLYSNTKAFQVWGLNESELIGKKYLEYIREDYRRKAEKFFFRQFVSKELTTYFEYPIVGLNNQEIWLGQNTQLIFEDGKPVGFQAVARDITLLKKTQEQLEESEQRYRNVIDVLQEGIVIQDENASIVTANKSAEIILGLTLDQMQGRTSLDPRWKSIHEDGSFFAGENHPAVVSLRTGQPLSNVIMGVHRSDDDLVWISIDSQPIFKNGNPKPEGVVVSFSDITSRKKAEAELLRSNANIEAWMNNTKDAIWSVDKQYNILACNDHFRELFELFFDTKINKNDNYIAKMPVESRENFIGLFEKALLGETFSIEYPLFKNGSITFFEVTFNPIYEVKKITGIAVHGKNITERKLQQDEIRRTKANLEAWMDNTNDGVWAIDKEFNLILMNKVCIDNCCTLIGHTPHLGDSALQLVQPELYDYWTKLYNRALAGQRFIEEQSIISIDDTLSYYEISFNPIFEGNDVRGVAVLSIDVTMRKQAEQALRQTMLLQQAILDSSAYMIIATTLEGTITTFNPAAEKAIGYSADEMIGIHSPAVFHDINEIIERAATLTQELGYEVSVGFDTFVAKARIGQLYVDEWTYIRKDGSRFPVNLSISSLKNSENEITGYLGIATDITVQKQTLDALEKRDILLEGTSKALRHLITAKNFEEGVFDALSIIGQSSSADRVYFCKSFLSEFELPTMQLMVEWHNPSIEVPEVKYHKFYYDDIGLERWYHVLSSGSVIQGARSDFPENERKILIDSGIHSAIVLPIILKGQLWGFLGAYDFHCERIWNDWERAALQSIAASLAGAIERHEAQENLKNQAHDLEIKNLELTIAREAAEIANHAKSTFLSSMSHELRTPLNAILGFAQILQKDKTLLEQNRNYISMMYRSGNHLLEMINDVLDISKIEAGQMELMFEEFDLHEFFSDIGQMFALRCREKNLDFHVHTTGQDLRFVVADQKRLKQVLINLVGNSVKFTSTGSINISAVETKRILEKEADGAEVIGWVRFSVTDTGRGIPPEQLQTIFQPFKQVSGMYSDGTGLGLAICDKIVRMMGGEITIQSELDVGSTFTFEIPIKICEVAIVAKKIEEKPIVGIKGDKKWRILVVDDISSNCIVARALLEPVGFLCDEANTGKTALDKVKEFKPDIILMDILMPEMCGDEATKILRKMPEYSHLPIIALTASGFDGKRDELMALGFSEYLRKPFLENELFELIKAFIPIEYIRENNAKESVLETDEVSISDLVQLIRELPDRQRKELSEAIEFQEFERIELLLDLLPDGTSYTQLAVTLRKAVLLSNYKVLMAITECMESDS
ncbi:MAG: PAS domain S-box protein [Bacteroidetes bacterium]|nr:PAS domain S-box protein [Bacteroidota bacterium]